ncbi:MAG: epoxide hydrolase family protein, partial [Gaiellaceae bacterium]
MNTHVDAIERFTIEIPDETLDDLARRLENTRWPDQVVDRGWDYGTNLEYLRDLCAYWLHDFDWRAQERSLNRLPQFIATIDGQRIHFVHVRSSDAAPLPLILTHGWPSSFVEMTNLIPRLQDFDLVGPSLPGYGFSDKPTDRFASARTPDLWAKLMAALGYERYGVHGGDIGAGVSTKLAQRNPHAVVGLHLLSVGGTIDSSRDAPSKV